jgi:hypothetical protein
VAERVAGAHGDRGIVRAALDRTPPRVGVQVVEHEARHPDHRRADEHHGHHPRAGALDADDDALVRGEQVGDVRDRVHVHRPQLPGM